MRKTPINSDKSALRKKKSAERRILSPQQVQVYSSKIIKRLDVYLAKLISENKLTNKVVMAYSPIYNEVDVMPWVENGGVVFSKVVFPKVVSKKEMKVGRGELVKGYQGILEPVQVDKDLSDGSLPIDVVLVPGLGFCEDGLGRLGRLGYGGGFYDRFIGRLSKKTNRPYLIGLFYEGQRDEAIPLAPHDIFLDCVITEVGVYL